MGDEEREGPRTRTVTEVAVRIYIPVLFRPSRRHPTRAGPLAMRSTRVKEAVSDRRPPLRL